MSKEKRSIDIIKDPDGNKIVFINDVIFKGRNYIHWKEVKEYLKRFIGNNYRIISDDEEVFIGMDLPNEYARSKYSSKIKGLKARAKANAVQGIPELIKIARRKSYKKNLKNSHNNNAKFGWYKYDTMFGIPKYNNKEIIGYTIFRATLLIRHSEDGKKYLYDLIDIKKETGTPLRP